MIRLVIILLSALLINTNCTNTEKKMTTAKVELKKNESGQYRLYVDGNEFFVKGAGLEFGDIKSLAENGGNSFRTWRTENGQRDAMEILDEAQKYGLKVLMGLEVGRERHGYSYDDTVWVNKQFNYLIGEVTRLKDHPALLGWAIGNELNLEQKDLRIYNSVNDLSVKIHEIDPYHLTTTTLAGIGKREVDYIKEHCTDIDFLSIQMYGDIVNLQQRISDAGWDGPYMVTEWGATGHWEVARTPWDASIEPTSKVKSKEFITRYDLAIEADKKNCLGSYVFLWGQKQERTPTWYGMFLKNGSKTETVDAMNYIWNGKWPANRCPSLDSLLMNGQNAFENITIKPRESFIAEVYFTNYENDSIQIVWDIAPESTDLKLGGDTESEPEIIFHKSGNSKEELYAPENKGPYRLFVYITDKSGGSATANIPFLVE